MDKIILHIPDSFRGRRNGSHIRWKDHVGHTMFIEYNDDQFPVVVNAVDGDKLTLSCNNKSVTLTIAMIGSKVRYQKKFGYCNAGKLLYLVDNNVFLGDTGWNSLIKYKYTIGQHIKNDTQDFIVKDRAVTSNKHALHLKKYLVHCNICTGDSWVNEDSISNKCMCQCCNNILVIPGINDIATTHPWAVKYFINKEDAMKYHSGTQFGADMICPICGHIYNNKPIRSLFINARGLNCCEYSYKSYPERFIHNMLTHLKVEFIPQAHLGENNDFRYDFYVPSKSCIIEVHGIQHYKNSFCNMSYEDIHANDKLKYAIGKSVVRHYVVLDCRKSQLSWIKNSVMTSSLPDILDFTIDSINWGLCDRDSKTNMDYDVCTEYMTNIDSTIPQLSSQFGVCISTIRNILHNGVISGLCNYDPNSLREKINTWHTRPVGIYKDNHLITIVVSCAAATKYFLEREFNLSDCHIEHKLYSAGVCYIGDYMLKREDEIIKYSDLVSRLEVI